MFHPVFLWFGFILLVGVPLAYFFGVNGFALCVVLGWLAALISHFNLRCKRCGWPAGMGNHPGEWSGHKLWRHEAKSFSCPRCEENNFWTRPFAKPTDPLPLPQSDWEFMVASMSALFPTEPWKVRYIKTLLLRVDAQSQLHLLDQAKANMIKTKHMMKKYKVDAPELLKQAKRLEEKLAAIQIAGDGDKAD